MGTEAMRELYSAAVTRKSCICPLYPPICLQAGVLGGGGGRGTGDNDIKIRGDDK